MGYKLKKTMGWVLESSNIDMNVLSKKTLLDLIKEDPDNYELVHLDLKYPNLNLKDTLAKFVIPVYNEDGEDEEESKPSDKIMYVFIPPQCIDIWNKYSDDVDSYLYPFFSEVKIKYIYESIFPFCNPFVADPSLTILNPKAMSDINYMNFLIKDKKEIPEDFIKTYDYLDLNKSLISQRYMSCPLIIKKILEIVSPINSLCLKPAILLYYR